MSGGFTQEGSGFGQTKAGAGGEGRLQNAPADEKAGMVCQTLLFSFSCSASIKLISRRGASRCAASPGMTDTFKEVD